MMHAAVLLRADPSVTLHGVHLSAAVLLEKVSYVLDIVIL